MRLLQRYIFFELLRLFLFLVSVLTLLLVFVGVFREASERGLGPVQIFQVLPYVAPSMLPFTIPATLLLTVCVVYGRVAGDNEVIAAKAAGINVMALLNPALLLGALLTVGSFALTNHVIPWASGNIESVIARAGGQIFLDVLASQHQVNDPERGFSITVTGVEGRTLKNPTFKKVIGDDYYIVQAMEASLDFDNHNQEVLVIFKKARMTKPGSRQEDWVEYLPQRFPLQRSRTKLQPRAMTISQIRIKQAELSRQRDSLINERNWRTSTALILGDFARLERESVQHYKRELKRIDNLGYKTDTEIHSRYALAASCFLFVLVGAPYAILKARQQFLTNFIVCFTPILLIYYPVMFLMLNLAKSGSVAPWWSMWIANIVIGIVGLSCLRKVVQH